MKVTGMSRPMAADGTIRFSTAAARAQPGGAMTSVTVPDATPNTAPIAIARKTIVPSYQPHFVTAPVVLLRFGTRYRSLCNRGCPGQPTGTVRSVAGQASPAGRSRSTAFGPAGRWTVDRGR